jgi:Mg-chelatase subunit ChlD
VELVFARGSGQGVDEGEANEFDAQVAAQIKPYLTTNIYQLGKETVDGHQYPAYAINGPGWAWGAWGTALGAVSSAGRGNAYGHSVDEGVAELTSYLTKRSTKCQDSKFVLAGYSQGAQVVGQAYSETLKSMRSKIVYNALFGDPKLNLPEGVARADTGFSPPACSGKELSPWRYNVTECATSSGSLDVRDPYLPAEWKTSTGLWCNAHDFVCGSSNYVLDADGHNQYKPIPGQAGSRIADAVMEISSRLAAALPPEKTKTLRDQLAAVKEGTSGLDVVFLIDSTGSMGGKIDQARTFVSTMSDRVKALHGRVALVEYKDSTDTVPARVLSGFKPDTADLQAKLAEITASGGNDVPEGLLHGLMMAFNTLEWKNGASKAAVVLTDADFHNPDLTDGSTLAQVLKRSLEIDPVNVYPVVPEYVADSYTKLAAQTSGKVIVDDGDSAAAFDSVLTNLEQRPVALLPLPKYSAPVGGSMTYDASKSYAVNGNIVSYDWDTNGDGTFDKTTSTPILEQVYPVAFDGVMQVRITDNHGGVASASANVHVGAAPPSVVTDAPTNLKAEVLSTTGTISTVQLSWASSDPRVGVWGMSIDGAVLGTEDASVRTMTFTDVERGKDVEFGVTGATKEGEVGQKATAVIPALAPVVTPPKSSDPPAPTTSASPQPSAPAPVSTTPAAAPVQTQAPSGPAPVTGAPVAVAGVVEPAIAAEVAVAAASPTPASTPTPAPSEPQAGAAAPSAAPSPSQAPPAASAPSTPVANLGPWPWLLGALVILGVAAVSLVYRRRNSA